jgi:hypothetical protein
MDISSYQHDVFISYSHKDGDWVWDELIPRLEEVGIRSCIDKRDFIIGVPSIQNMEMAIDNSRYVLAILTSDWIDSEWTDFEILLVQTSDPAARRQRLIPLLLKPCTLPSRISMLTYLDFTNVLDQNWNRLLKIFESSNTDTITDQNAQKNTIFGGNGLDRLKQDLNKAVTITGVMLEYWRMKEMPTSDAIITALEDATTVLDVLQQSKIMATAAKLERIFIIRLSDAVDNNYNESCDESISGIAFARAIAAYSAPDGRSDRAPLGWSSAYRPKRRPQPSLHSKLSTSVHRNTPRTSTPSPMAWRTAARWSRIYCGRWSSSASGRPVSVI